ncbi:hypothetical protein EMCRGX_G011853 [Ephydatia muelleri]
MVEYLPSLPLAMYHTAMQSENCEELPADPRVWSRDQVAVWLHKSAVQYRLRSSNPERFPMNGKALVLMTKEMFLYRVPEGGGFLYEDIQFRLQKLFTDSLDEATRDALLQITQS